MSRRPRFFPSRAHEDWHFAVLKVQNHRGSQRQLSAMINARDSSRNEILRAKMCRNNSRNGGLKIGSDSAERLDGGESCSSRDWLPQRARCAVICALLHPLRNHCRSGQTPCVTIDRLFAIRHADFPTLLVETLLAESPESGLLYFSQLGSQLNTFLRKITFKKILASYLKVVLVLWINIFQKSSKGL